MKSPANQATSKHNLNRIIKQAVLFQPAKPRVLRGTVMPPSKHCTITQAPPATSLRNPEFPQWSTPVRRRKTPLTPSILRIKTKATTTRLSAKKAPKILHISTERALWKPAKVPALRKGTKTACTPPQSLNKPRTPSFSCRTKSTMRIALRSSRTKMIFPRARTPANRWPH